MILDGKVAIVTGGTRGIGFETVRQFLLNGAKVCLLGSRAETVEKAIQTLKSENQNFSVIGFYPNLTSESEVTKTFESVKTEFGKIDILINNAGISSSTPLVNFSEAEYDKIADINIKSVFICSKVAVPYLKETKGVILNTSSMVSVYGQPSGVMYPASKFAVNGITKSLARELAPMGIRVNAVAPGITETDMVSALPKQMIEPLIKTIPLGRIGTPADIANAFLFLASDMASYITGDILHVDGAARA
ncbi:MAG: SDR family NAD(P)-dependent oxidoreductase [Treponema sp.]